jgi:hypothetical protein
LSKIRPASGSSPACQLYFGACFVEAAIPIEHPPQPLVRARVAGIQLDRPPQLTLRCRKIPGDPFGIAERRVGFRQIRIEVRATASIPLNPADLKSIGR